MTNVRKRAIKMYWKMAKKKCPFQTEEIVNGYLEGFIDCAEYLILQIAELEEQIEKMKCCQNCKFEDNDCIEEPCSACTRCLGDIKRKGNSDKWELQENNNEQARTERPIKKP